MDSVPTGWRARLAARRHRSAALTRLVQRRYSRLFWALHSAWALLSGVAVLVLAHNRYGFLRWVVLFIALTWGSTLFFSRFAMEDGSRAMRLARSVVSYLTRVMYQETLFFLIPFYFYSTTFPSANSLFLLVIAGLAVLSCYDVLFDRLLRESTGFSVLFFAFVSFSALQFFLPLLLRVRIASGTYLAAGVSFAAAMALAHGWDQLRQPRRLALLALGLLAVLGAVRLLRPMLPPVPLRLTRLRLSGALNTKTLTAPSEFGDVVSLHDLRSGRLYAVATVFSPQRIPATLQIRFVTDGVVQRTSRTLALTASPNGFRMWDSLRAGQRGFAPGTVRVEVRSGDQLLGRRVLRIR